MEMEQRLCFGTLEAIHFALFLLYSCFILGHILGHSLDISRKITLACYVNKFFLVHTRDICLYEMVTCKKCNLSLHKIGYWNRFKELMALSEGRIEFIVPYRLT